MKRTRRHNIEGAILDIPLRYDQRARMDIEEYADLLAKPVYTPAGCPILLTVEDACQYAEAAEEGAPCIDCGSCRFYRQAPGSLLGVCGHEKRRRG